MNDNDERGKKLSQTQLKRCLQARLIWMEMNVWISVSISTKNEMTKEQSDSVHSSNTLHKRRLYFSQLTILSKLNYDIN